MGKLIFNLKSEDDKILYYNLIKYTNLCVVDFYAEWCMPCKKLGVDLVNALPQNKYLIESCLSPEDPVCSSLQYSSNLSTELKNYLSNKNVFVKIDIDEMKEMINEMSSMLSQNNNRNVKILNPYKFTSIPHVIFYKNGTIHNKSTNNLNELLQIANELV